MKKIILALSLIFASSVTWAASSMKVTVNGMVCAFCAQGIEKRLSKMTETKAVFVDLKKKIVVVESKEGSALNEAAIAAEIKDAGYDVVKTESITKTVAEFKVESGAKK